MSKKEWTLDKSWPITELDSNYKNCHTQKRECKDTMWIIDNDIDFSWFYFFSFFFSRPHICNSKGLKKTLNLIRANVEKGEKKWTEQKTPAEAIKQLKQYK